MPLLFVSGQSAINASGEVVGADDIIRQARQTFGNIQALLEDQRSSLRDVVKLTIFLTDIGFRGAVADVRREFWGDSDYPASTLVEVSRLGNPKLLIEVEAIAALSAAMGRPPKDEQSG